MSIGLLAGACKTATMTVITALLGDVSEHIAVRDSMSRVPLMSHLETRLVSNVSDES